MTRRKVFMHQTMVFLYALILSTFPWLTLGENPLIKKEVHGREKNDIEMIVECDMECLPEKEVGTDYDILLDYGELKNIHPTRSSYTSHWDYYENDDPLKKCFYPCKILNQTGEVNTSINIRVLSVEEVDVPIDYVDIGNAFSNPKTTSTPGLITNSVSSEVPTSEDVSNKTTNPEDPSGFETDLIDKTELRLLHPVNFAIIPNTTETSSSSTTEAFSTNPTTTPAIVMVPKVIRLIVFEAEMAEASSLKKSPTDSKTSLEVDRNNSSTVENSSQTVPNDENKDMTEQKLSKESSTTIENTELPPSKNINQEKITTEETQRNFSGEMDKFSDSFFTTSENLTLTSHQVSEDMSTTPKLIEMEHTIEGKIGNSTDGLKPQELNTSSSPLIHSTLRTLLLTTSTNESYMTTEENGISGSFLFENTTTANSNDSAIEDKEEIEKLADPLDELGDLTGRSPDYMELMKSLIFNGTDSDEYYDDTNTTTTYSNSSDTY